MCLCVWVYVCVDSFKSKFKQNIKENTHLKWCSLIYLSGPLSINYFRLGSMQHREYFHLFYEIVDIFTYPISLTAIWSSSKQYEIVSLRHVLLKILFTFSLFHPH